MHIYMGASSMSITNNDEDRPEPVLQPVVRHDNSEAGYELMVNVLIVAGVAVLCMVAGLCVYCWRRRSKYRGLALHAPSTPAILAGDAVNPVAKAPNATLHPVAGASNAASYPTMGAPNTSYSLMGASNNAPFPVTGQSNAVLYPGANSDLSVCHDLTKPRPTYAAAGFSEPDARPPTYEESTRAVGNGKLPPALFAPAAAPASIVCQQAALPRSMKSITPNPSDS